MAWDWCRGLYIPSTPPTCGRFLLRTAELCLCSDLMLPTRELLYSSSLLEGWKGFYSSVCMFAYRPPSVSSTGLKLLLKLLVCCEEASWRGGRRLTEFLLGWWDVLRFSTCYCFFYVTSFSSASMFFCSMIFCTARRHPHSCWLLSLPSIYLRSDLRHLFDKQYRNFDLCRHLR